MKRILATIALLASCSVSGADVFTGSPIKRAAPVTCEIMTHEPVDGEVSLLLHVEAGDCIESVRVGWYSWADNSMSDTMTMQQEVMGADSVTFPIAMRIPEPNFGEFCLTVGTLQKKVESEDPCYRVLESVDRRGRTHTERREVNREDGRGQTTIVFWITDGRVDFAQGFRGRNDGHISRSAPWIRTGGDSLTQLLADTTRTRLYSQPGYVGTPDDSGYRELTEEEKRALNSKLGWAAPLTEAQKMAKLEEAPLEGMDRQFFSLDGVIYVRDRGETKFHVSEPRTLEEMQAWALSRQDSIAAIPPETEFEVRMWLTEPADLEYARELVDSLRLSDEPDCYITRTSLEVIHLLEKRGIKTAPIAKVFRGRQTSPSAP